jgi:hypothetical protein
MPLILSGSVDISGSMTATTIVVSSPGAAGMVSSSAQITELVPLMAYTASLKSVAIVSSSQQIQNYNLFAVTSSANIFYGTQTITGSLNASGSVGINGVVTIAGNAIIGGSNQINLQRATSKVFQATTVATNISTDGANIPLRFSLNSTSQTVGQFQGTTGNLTLQNSNTPNDNGARLQVIASSSQDALYVSGSSSFTGSVNISGSLNVSGSSHTIQNGYVILQQVSQSLNFVDDTAAAAGGVPLGGLYRNGNFIVIRIV